MSPGLGLSRGRCSGEAPHFLSARGRSASRQLLSTLQCGDLLGGRSHPRHRVRRAATRVSSAPSAIAPLLPWCRMDIWLAVPAPCRNNPASGLAALAHQGGAAGEQPIGSWAGVVGVESLCPASRRIAALVCINQSKFAAFLATRHAAAAGQSSRWSSIRSRQKYHFYPWIDRKKQRCFNSSHHRVDFNYTSCCNQCGWQLELLSSRSSVVGPVQPARRPTV